MSILKKFQKQSAVIRLFVAAIIIVPIQTSLLLSIITEAAISSLKDNVQYFFPDNPVTMIAFFILPIVYYTIVSLLFTPKRLVSPMFIQIGTMVVFSLIIIVQAFSSTTSFSTPQGFQNLVVSLVVIAVIAIIVGSVQETVVRKVIGLNFDGVDRASFAVTMSPNDFLKTVWEVIHDVWEFNRKKDSPKKKTNIIWVLKTRDASGNSVILTVGSVQGDEKQSIVATAAYHVGSYSISKTSTEMRKSIIRDINGLLTEKRQAKLDPY